MPLETPRLAFRPLAWGDLPFFTALHADPVVARYLVSGKPRTGAETRAWLEMEMRWSENRASIRVAERTGITPRSDLEFVGRTFRRYEISREEWERTSREASP